MTTYVLILWVLGWGYGLGSQGNSITALEFNSRERCEAALNEITSRTPVKMRDAVGGVCVRK